MISKIALNVLKGINRKFNTTNWKDLRHTQPISDMFGYDRGDQSVHRYYIDEFVRECADKISGTALEVADRMYLARHAERLSESHVIHYNEDRGTNSFIGDLTRKETLPAEKFDCFVCTQTYNFIYDFKAAIEGSHFLLKPGGYLVATVSGIQQISTFDASRWGDYWRFTGESAKRMFGDVFGSENVQVVTYGNVLAAIASLEGLSSSEITKSELAFRDPSYELIIGILAHKLK
ncbi:methyltransferase domain-containing protein [Chryseolinea lacunae]|uniref:Class I SAM-dependent methyltransferase n=1 Tax=Chryseolinea lacunae TaxID=2801331 RepID=A0ABS1KS82_9BACT|nr:class I SAM-dependent methyltransferase [Chryseolinea lacunae]MBL0742219.1 class I SAM-dependent methyltransferase [Chryseolinea lacunae]